MFPLRLAGCSWLQVAEKIGNFELPSNAPDDHNVANCADNSSMMAAVGIPVALKKGIQCGRTRSQDRPKSEGRKNVFASSSEKELFVPLSFATASRHKKKRKRPRLVALLCFSDAAALLKMLYCSYSPNNIHANSMDSKLFNKCYLYNRR